MEMDAGGYHNSKARSMSPILNFGDFQMIILTMKAI